MAARPEQSEAGYISLRNIQLVNWLLLLLLSGASLAIFSSFIAQSVFLGGAVANISFGLLKRNLLSVLSGPLRAAKGLFFIKYYLRLILLVLVLVAFIRYRLVHFIGLLVGLSTVALSIGVNVAGVVKKIYFSTKEAS